MTPLSREDVSQIEDLRSAKVQLAIHADLLRSTLAINKMLEERIRTLSSRVEAGEQHALMSGEQLDDLKKRMFGDKSEKRVDDGPGPLFDGKSPDEACAENPDGQGKKKKKKRTKFGRKEQPALPRVEIKHELSEEEMKTEGLKKWEGQFEISELINVIPTQIQIEIHKRQKYLATESRDPSLPAIVTAPGPIKTQEGCRYGLEFDIEVALGKYLWHLPLDRQCRMMLAKGLDVDSQTLFSRIDMLAWYLEGAVMPRLVAEIHGSRVKMADETTWKNLEKRPKHGKKKRFFLWAVRTKRAVMFAVYDGRSGKIAQTFLHKLEGVLLVDGFKGYNPLESEKLVIARDWVHGRRKFIAAEKTHPTESGWFIAEMKKLFKIEESLAGKTLDEIRVTRQLGSRPIVEGIKKRLDELGPKVLPRSALGKAIDYMQVYWPGLIVFLDDPEVPIHTNPVESVIRGPVVGRKNHYGSKNLKTGKVAAIFYSVIETCKANGVDPRKYLHEVMKVILDPTKKQSEKKIPMPWDVAPAVKAA